MDCIKCKKGIPEDALFCPYCGKKQIQERKKRKRANGQGMVRKKPGLKAKPWEARKNGVHIGYYATRYEAERAIMEMGDRRTLSTINATFAQVYARWLPEHSRDLTPSGIAGYENAYKRCTVLHDSVFRNLRTSDFQAVIMEMEAAGKAKSTCEKVVQLFGQMSKWAIREGIASTNYAQFVSIKAKQKKTRTPFTEEQVRAIGSAKHPAAQVAVLLLATGCRPNELFSAKLEDCHDGYFVSGSKTEAGRNRVIPVSPFGLNAYDRLRKAAEDAGGAKLIDGYHGNRVADSYAKRDWKELMEEVGITGMTPYNCRHTYATMAVQAGVKPEILQKILGHADYSTTVDVYTHMGIAEILEGGRQVEVVTQLWQPEK